MAKKPVYLIIDVGTGNVRVAITETDGHILSLSRQNMDYNRDYDFSNALFFDPQVILNKIFLAVKEVLLHVNSDEFELQAITVSSQREGIVLLDMDGIAFVGYPNHDHRGRAWEQSIGNKDRIYKLTGRNPTSLFSVFKLIGTKKKQPNVFQKIHKALSISDWVQYELSGKMGYEHSQASETLLYDVAKMSWSKELEKIFEIPLEFMPDLHSSGDILGVVKPEIAKNLMISPEVVIIVGGSDTQLAIMSTKPAIKDIIIVSGTTTPCVKLVSEYLLDKSQRTWTGRHTVGKQFVLETNAGVTGLNIQKLKALLYPSEGYEQIERELPNIDSNETLASLGSTISGKSPLNLGGFFFDVPIGNNLGRAEIFDAALWDIACSIYENYCILNELEPDNMDYVWGCGGGFQSPRLINYLSGLLKKEIRIRKGFNQASVSGATVVCNETLGFDSKVPDFYTIKFDGNSEVINRRYTQWKSLRKALHNFETEINSSYE
ncbi:YoaC [Indibacter alkaliphilus LW1]|uniref:YoaC n=1 Tax=Indibacter alkaliphilus (strain CCUG 57479 / KCTC 22604 / LW1) TaxID=1189612 RepID=S2DTB9_INDAL|nr:FGGY family carbohydrate kinase [Indibacter alkaliphilus]EOZ95336.1 YoaC [Indibacter alkaliphilus LW1]